MIENKILSLDLGSNSVGAIIRNLAEENQFEKATVVTFETGVAKDKENKYTISLAANRTDKRGIRNLYQSRKYKLWAVLADLTKDKSHLYCPISEESLKRWKHYNKEEALKGNGGRQYPVDDVAFANWIKLAFDGDGAPDYISPYQLRKELATTKLDFSKEENRFKLGRALYHIAQHRGFKSSKIVKNKDDGDEEKINLEDDIIIGAEKPKQEKFQKAIERLGFQFNADSDTTGMVFATIETDGIHHAERKTEGIRIRKELHQYVTRKMLIKEVKQIFDFQGLDFSSIFGEEPSKSSIFWQQPLKSQKGTVGICTLESHFEELKDKNGEPLKDKHGNIQIREVGKKRCPVSRPEFEEFRALSFINNIQYRIKGQKDSQWQTLPQPMRDALYTDKFFVQKDFEFSAVIKWIKDKNKHDNWELNYNFKTNVSACIVSTRLKNTFGEKWNSIITRKDKNSKDYSSPFFEDTWHVLFEAGDEDFIEEYGKEKLHLEPPQINKLRSLWYAMPVGYGQLSLKAINNILPFLRQGFIYTDAVLLGKVPEILGTEIWEAKKAFITEALQKQIIEKNRDEKRVLNIVNNLISQYKALPKNRRYADHDFEYKIGSRDQGLPADSIERDDNQILSVTEEGFGKERWNQLSAEVRNTLLKEVTELYQSFFSNKGSAFYSLPRLADAMKEFIKDNFEQFYEGQEQKKFLNRLEKIYHPSMMAFYPEAKEGFYKNGDIEKRMVMLGSPKTGAFKNPMAMRTMHEVRKLVNYFIATGQVDEKTRVIVEIPREANLEDTNKRYAYTVYQQTREEENKEFATAIQELLNDPEGKGSLANADNDSDIDKFRLWYEMIESQDGFVKNGKFVTTEEDKKPVEKKTGTKQVKSKQQETSDENELYEFSENNYQSIKKELWIKLKNAKDNVLEKYRLWKEQQYFCMYTGKPIKITDLFKEDLIDIEHTIPRSLSFDNSLANKTVCYADFNRNVKKNRIPFSLDNYDDIKQRIERWENKVKDLQVRVEFWKGKSKRAQNPEDKNYAVRQKHLWKFELDYWQNKVERFAMKEIKPGFKNSQLKDTQLASKYAFHYLKSFFHHVEVQKGEVVAEFRKIFGLQPTNTAKDRSKHSHHAKDAIVLSIIPTAAIRDRMLELWYKIKEKEQLLKSTNENKNSIKTEIDQLKEELQELKFQCRLPKGLNESIKKLDEELLINNVARNRSLIPASKKIKVDGKTVVAKGDAVRGQIHLATFYGKNREVKRDDSGRPERNESGDFVFEKGKDEFSFVLRKDADKTLKVEKIVDPHLKKMIEKQMNGRTLSATIAEDGGLYMVKKDGSWAHKLRHIRCYADDVSDPVQVKSQSIQGSKEHKNYYWAKNGENIICALYQKEKEDKKGNKKFDRVLEIITLKDVADLVTAGEIGSINDLQIYRKDKEGKALIDESGNKELPYAILKPDMKLIFYDDTINELSQQAEETLSEYTARISYRTYTISKFTGGRLTLQHHMEARLDPELKKAYPENQVFKRDEKGKDVTYGGRGTSGFTEKVSDALKCNSNNNFEPWPRLLYSVEWLNMAIEGKHFEVKPDGEINWFF